MKNLRQTLIEFVSYLDENSYRMKTKHELLDDYLDSINEHHEETPIVIENKDKKEVCPICKNDMTIYNSKYEFYRCPTCGHTWT